MITYDKRNIALLAGVEHGEGAEQGNGFGGELLVVKITNGHPKFAELLSAVVSPDQLKRIGILDGAGNPTSPAQGGCQLLEMRVSHAVGNSTGAGNGQAKEAA